MTRECGGCTLCCKLVPVHHGAQVNGVDMPGSWHKAAGERCRHQRTGKGCAVYRKPGFPACCALWNCRWLVGDGTENLRRPDRSHYVLDVMPDYVTVFDDDPDKGAPIEVVQIWIDPKYPDAHEDPALRDYLNELGKKNVAAIIRYNSDTAFVLFPPSMSSDGEWHEKRNGTPLPTRSAKELFDGIKRAREIAT